MEIEALGQRALLPGPLAVSRTLYIVYVDEEIMIVRDESGLPSVLRRAEKVPSATSSSLDEYDDDAPSD